MPYGIKNETPEMTKWMEKCVDSITGTNKRTGKPYKNGEKIAICKFNLKKHGMKKEASSELSMREEMWELEQKIRDSLGRPNDISPSYGSYVDDIFDDYVVISKDNKLYKVDWDMSGDTVTIDWGTAVEVERKTVYEPVVAEREIPKIPNIIRGTTQKRTYGKNTIN